MTVVLLLPFFLIPITMVILFLFDLSGERASPRRRYVIVHDASRGYRSYVLSRDYRTPTDNRVRHGDKDDSNVEREKFLFEYKFRSTDKN